MWVHNDSGNPPILFAIRPDGRVVREFPLAVPNLDWEDIATDGRGHLYLADIGNNGGLMAVRAVYQFDEPNPGEPRPTPLRPRAAWFYRFPESGRFDAEGLYLAGGGEKIIIVSKRLDGREAELYSIPSDRPAPLFRPAMPLRLGTLPRFVEPVTGTSLSADGSRLAACSYTITRVYERGGNDEWRLLSEVRYPFAEIEAITWDGLDLILASEGGGLERIPEKAWKDRSASRPSTPQGPLPSGSARARDQGP
ncbi:MAG: hypothetical protein U0790_20460 [Isosphaeraceae bacterium]